MVAVGSIAFWFDYVYRFDSFLQTTASIYCLLIALKL